MKKINGHQLRLNWTKHRNIKKINNVNDNRNDSNNNTVNNIYHIIFILLNIQLYVGNLDGNIKEEELLSFFKNKFKSVVSCKIIYDSINNISKGFGFVSLSDNEEYNSILKNKEKIILKDKPLIIK